MKQGVDLAHALCQSVADDAGVRVLFLKGPAAGRQGLRSTAHVSGDVDILCLPADRPAIEAGLHARGWRLRPVSTAAREFTTHSITFIHDSWPCDIDVHTAFPGMLADPATAFEALWRCREEQTFAGVAAMTPNRSAQFLVLLLHGLRSPGLARNTRDIETARATYRTLTADERAALRELVAASGSAEPTQDFFRSVGDPVEVPSRPSADYALWQLKTRPSRTESWMLLALRTHGTQRLRVLFLAVLPTRADMYADHPDSAQSFARLVVAHGRRLSRAARLAPAALRQIVRARQAVRSSAPTVSTPPGRALRAVRDAGHRGALLCDAPARASVIAPHAAEWTDDHEVLFVLPLHSSSSTVLALRDTAADLWMLLQDTGTSAERLASAACARWRVPTDTVRSDVELFLSQLVDWGALVAA